jgi:glycosyltransferase involved in cell wall biosynthesis
VAALNHGLKNSSAHYIARMDADDRMYPQRLQRQLDYMEQQPEITLVASQARLFPEALIQDGFREYMRWQNGCLSPQQIADEIYVESPMVHPTVFFRREPILQVGGYREGLFPEDYDLWLRLHGAGHRMAKLDEILLDWREDPARTSRTDPRCSRDAFDALRAKHLATEARFLSRHDNFVIWGAGRKTRKRCDHLLQRGFAPRAWIDIDPNKIGNRLNGVPVVAPEWLQREPRPFVLGYVANHGARDLIATQLQEMGYAPGTDYLMVG